ncbi:MAG: hypothetical protein EOM24_32705, partial [Chloroflexia bacterium]|nr:hypothetical protein [Chloroflexia bacterium]
FVLRRELVLIHRLLMGAGIPCLALKGAFLDFDAYPQLGLRPLRDLDILVPASDALRAYEILLAAGLVRVQEPDCQGDPEATIAIQKQHLPPLRTTPSGVTVEVHARLYHLNQGTPKLVDPSTDVAFWQRAVEVRTGGETLRFPAPNDMLLHLIVHAVLDHKFSNGPLVLSDVAFLLERQTIDWGLFWQAAEQGGLQRACWLIFQLVEHYWGGDNIRWPEMPETIAGGDRALEQAALLMLRDLSAARDVLLARALALENSPQAKLSVLFGRLFPPKLRVASFHPVREDSALIYFYYIPYIWRRVSYRMPQFLKARRQAHIQDEIELLDNLESWLAG